MSADPEGAARPPFTAPGMAFPVRPGMDLTGLRAVVMGLGGFSGGVETVRWLAARGARVTVTDLKDEAALSDSLARIEGLADGLHLGGHREEDFTGADLVVASPAVDPGNRFLLLAARAGVPLMTELSLAMGLLPCPAVWVTGTCGKSTTTALLGEILSRAEMRAHVGGNIGRALIARAEGFAAGDVAVLEVSSFQLEWTARDGIRPSLAVVTNVTPNHLDRHRSFDRYVEAKAAALPEDGPVILNADDPVCRERLLPRVRGRAVSASLSGAPGAGARLRGVRAVLGEEELFSLDDLGLVGDFNRMNALQAAVAARLLGARPGSVREGIRGFRGLPHRLEDLGLAGSVRGVNDSKATSPQAAIRAMEALPGPLVLVAGGYERGAELGEFARVIRERARAVVLLGESAARLEAALGEEDPPRLTARSIEEAVDRGLHAARPGDTLLLSPGHASWDMFRSYEERGDRFRAAFGARKRRES